MFIISVDCGSAYLAYSMKDARAIASTASRNYHAETTVTDCATGELVAVYQNGHPAQLED